MAVGKQELIDSRLGRQDGFKHPNTNVKAIASIPFVLFCFVFLPVLLVNRGFPYTHENR